MRSSFHGLEVAKRGLFAQQSALNTTSHNIANANTEGYTRQRANMRATTGLPYVGLNASREPGLLGTGVQVTELQRIREDFLDVQFRNENKHYGYYSAQSDALTKLEKIMNEPSDTGLQKVMDDLWKSWQELSSKPENQASRTIVRERAMALAETFAALHTSMEELKNDLDNVVKVNAMEINSIAQQIANLNKQIGDVVPHGYQPNDLYDQRDVLIDRLSKLADIKVTNAESGMVNVTIQGLPLVTTITSVEMAVVYNETTKLMDITLGGEQFIPASGSLAGTFRARGEGTVTTDANGNEIVTYKGVIPELQTRLNILAVNLAKEVNAIHAQGINLTDIKAGKSTPSNLLFFVDADALKENPPRIIDPRSAASVAIHPDIVKSLDAIAAAKVGVPDPNTPGTSFEGDGSNARDIAAIKFKVIDKGTGATDLTESSTLDDFYRYTIAKLGVDSQQAQRMEKNSETLLGAVENQRLSVSGVSIDEEMSNIVKYQHAYSASARMMTAVDEILDKIINGMGRVGL
jgi:flagellar hook-associated protein 1 FlgK